MIWTLHFLFQVQWHLSPLSYIPCADVGGGRTARCDRMGVKLARGQRSAKRPKHSPEAHQQPGSQLGKKLCMNILLTQTHTFHVLYRCSSIMFPWKTEATEIHSRWKNLQLKNSRTSNQHSNSTNGETKHSVCAEILSLKSEFFHSKM